MLLGIDPKNDYAFKLVFGSPNHTDITVHFLNSVLNLQHPISEVEILNPIQGKDRSASKLIVLDILARDAVGRVYNIEMQTTLPIDLTQRIAYYGALNLTRQIGPGDAYYQIRPAISICLLSRNLFNDVAEYHLSFRLRCDQHPLVFTDILEFHTIELLKFDPRGSNVAAYSPLEKWLYFLKHAEQAEASELSEQLADKQITNAIGVLEMISRSPEDRQYYEARQKFRHDEKARLLAAEAAGHEQGLKDGLKEGIEEGLEKGFEKGRTEGEKAATITTIQILRGLLGQSSDDELLAVQSLDVLKRLVLELQEELRNRKN